MEAMSTVDMGLRLDTRRLDDRDMRLLDIEDWEERAEAMDEEGDVERGVETSDELAVLNCWYDAIGTMACAGEVEEEGEEGGEQPEERESWRKKKKRELK